MPSIFDIDFQQSATAGCGWLAVGTRRNIGIVWLAPRCLDDSEEKQRATTAMVEGETASYFQSNFNLKDQAGEVCGGMKLTYLFTHVFTCNVYAVCGDSLS